MCVCVCVCVISQQYYVPYSPCSCVAMDLTSLATAVVNIGSKVSNAVGDPEKGLRLDLQQS